MSKIKKRGWHLIISLAIVVVLVQVSCLQLREKIGILVITAGIEEEYKPEWMVGFFDHLFPFFPKGFFAGGPKEGGACYTLIHYANEVEAFICGVDVGTPIDAFCNEYTGTYPIHSLGDHWFYDEETFSTNSFHQI